jgi:hypothetical protein
MIWIKKVDLASLMREITNEETLITNNVKVCGSKWICFVLFAFGNSVSREKCGRSVHATHQVYAFRKQALLVL